MASKEINDFTAKDPVVGTDEALIQETAGGTTKKALLSVIKDWIFQQIGGYAAKGTLVDSDEFIIQETGSGASKKVLASALKTYTSSSTPFLHIQDQRTAGTNGGSSSSGNNIRVLNAVVTNTISGSSLSSNQITLPIGTYELMASAPGFKAGDHVIRLYNVTGGVYDAILGQNEQSGGGDSVSTRSMVIGQLTVAGSSKVFEVHHDIATAQATTGLGVAHSATTEVYTDVQIWKIG